MRDTTTESKTSRVGNSPKATFLSQIRELERQNAELQEVLSVAGHDLKQPIRNLRASAERLARSQLPQLEGEARELLMGLLVGARKTERLIEDLLIYSRVLGGPLKLQRVDLNETLEWALQMLCAEVEEQRAHVTHDVLPVVRADGARMIQLLQNLVANALLYRGEEAAHVHLAAHRGPNEWIVSVRDQGIGVAPDDRERIFEAFHRLHAEERYPGTGLGLAICRKIVERHGGKIWMEPSPERGATLVFTLPTQPAAGRASGRHAESEAGGSA
jgi:light-regulated signal transduction histidine kinase (bacteriophytochrome)